MQTPFPFDTVIIFGWLACMLIIGIVLRAKVSLFQRYLLPSCLLGGIIGFGLINTKVLKVSVSDLETFAYHFFNISFISLGLTAGDREEKTSVRGKDVIRGSTWLALVQGSSFGLQAAVCGLLVAIFNFVGLELFPTFGFLLPLGFEEGPGQALSIGKVWEGLGFQHAATIGLTFAALGFGFAFFVGVPLANWGIRNGLAVHASNKLSKGILTGIVSADTPKESAGRLTLHPSNVDSLAFQAALAGLVYLLTYFLVKFTSSLLAPDSAKIIWGFYFAFGLLVAILVRTTIRFMGHEYLIDPGIQRRITGWSVDFLIVSTVMAIQLPLVKRYILPISILSLIAGTLTTMIVIYFGKRLPQYNLERTVAVYGAVTGTVSTGLLLLRITDPDFRTPVAIEIAIMNLFSIPIILACMVLVNAPVWWYWDEALTSLIFLGIMVVCLVVLRVLKFWGPPKF